MNYVRRCGFGTIAVAVLMVFPVVTHAQVPRDSLRDSMVSVPLPDIRPPIIPPARKAAFDARIGVLLSSILMRDQGVSQLVRDSLSADYAGETEIRLMPSPVLSMAYIQPLGGANEVELAVSYGLGSIKADNDIEDWTVQEVGIASAVVALRHNWRRGIALHGGVGATRFVSSSKALFSDGSSILPLLELGSSMEFTLPLVLVLDVRGQLHSFGTPALRKDGASDGRVLRLLMQGALRARGGAQ